MRGQDVSYRDHLTGGLRYGRALETDGHLTLVQGAIMAQWVPTADLDPVDDIG